MQTIEEIARELVRTDATYGWRKWEDLPEPVKEVYLKLAERYNAEDRAISAMKTYEEDKIAAQTWGGDIDLVSFEGE